MVTEAVWDVFEEVLNKIFADRFLDRQHFLCCISCCIS